MLKQCGDGGDLRFLSVSSGRSAGETVGGRETGQTCQMFPLLSGFCTQQALGGKGDCPVLFLAGGEVSVPPTVASSPNRLQGPGLFRMPCQCSGKTRKHSLLAVGVWAPEVQMELREGGGKGWFLQVNSRHFSWRRELWHKKSQVCPIGHT